MSVAGSFDEARKRYGRCDFCCRLFSLFGESPHRHRLFVRPFQPLPLTPSLIIPRRPTLLTILVNYKASGRSVGAPSMRKRTWQPKNASWLSNGVPPSVMGSAPVSEFSWSVFRDGQGRSTHTGGVGDRVFR